MKVGYLNSIIQRIPIRKPCKGYYLRWYYSGWHYWFFLPGEMNMETVGEAYRTIGTRKISIGSGQLTYPQAQAIRTILLTREIYLLTADGWKNIRVKPSSVITLENMVNGYEMEFVMIIGSKEISYETGYTPVPIIPVVDPIPDPGACERIIGTQVWACKNCDSDYPGSKVFNDDEANRAIYGGLYTFNQIMAAEFVPPGWHIPTLAEWEILIDFVGVLIAGKELKEVGTDHWDAPNTGADTYGFAALGAGFRYYSSYYSLKQLARIWTASEYSSDRGYYVEMNYNNDDAIIKSLIKESYLSVRLIKDIPPVFNDWFLPSKDELDEMYNELKVFGIGNFTDNYYWSSSEVSDIFAWYEDFADGSQFNDRHKSNLVSVRACRSFIAAIGAYSLKDVGPAGGWIFHIEGGTNYYEAAPSDQSISKAWSNITTVLIGTTGTAIGTGLANTDAIIAQPGHNDSAAKLCKDLVI